MSTCLPEIIKDAIAREMGELPIGHYPHPTLERMALCGREILGIPTFGEFALCTECAVLAAAQDRTPPPE
jgi:hypothetical protein